MKNRTKLNIILATITYVCKEDSICFNCSNRKIVNGILVDECGIKYGIRDYFAYGSKQEIVDYLKEYNYKTLNDVLEDLN